MEDDLRALSGPEDGARAAFDRLIPHLLRFLRSLLRGRLFEENAREEVVGDVLAKLWSGRTNFQYEGLGRWWAYVRKSARMCVSDHYRRRGVEAPSERIEEEPTEEEWPLVDALARAALLERIYTAADELWLGISTETCPALEERVLTMQLYRESGVRPDEADGFAGVDPGAEFDVWCEDDAVLLAQAYRTFYMANDPLCAAVLGCDAEDLNRLAPREGDPPPGWTWSEASTVGRRFRNGLLDEQILRFSDCEQTPEELEALWERCRARFPARESAPALRRSLDDRRADAVAKSDLWRRLAFQYHYADDLPVKQSQERIAPAQKPFMEPTKFGALNMWLSGGRLAAQLAAYVAQADVAKGER